MLIWAIIATLLALGLGVYATRRNLALSEQRTLVTELTQQAATYEASVARERITLLDSLSEALFLLDRNGEILFCNKSALKLLGQRDLIGRTIDGALTDSALAQTVADSLASLEPTKSHVVLSSQSSRSLHGCSGTGETAWIVDTAPLDNFGAGVISRVILLDVTTQYQAEQVRKDFVANASHELRTPLAIIEGYLENLIEDDLLDDHELSLRFLTIMRKHSDRLARIVEDMLVISRLESGEAVALNKERFSVAACFQDVVERLESVIQTHNATVEISVEPEGLSIHGDRFYWTQVLFNLIENALKQNPEKRITIKTGAHLIEGHIELYVTDNGIGIPAVDIPFIFRRFYRVQKHHSQEEIKGTGLGLSIVKRAVEAHNGTLSVESEPGKFTTFTMKVPS